jgi:hypothetical protein
MYCRESNSNLSARTVTTVLSFTVHCYYTFTLTGLDLKTLYQTAKDRRINEVHEALLTLMVTGYRINLNR